MLTYRELFTAMATIGIASEATCDDDTPTAEIATRCVNLADEMCKALGVKPESSVIVPNSISDTIARI